MLDRRAAAVDAAGAVERVVVVTGEGRAERVALRAAQRLTTPIEVLRDPSDDGHSEAATLGIIRARALGAECVALLPGDCPLLDPAELDAALERATEGRVGVIPDRHGDRDQRPAAGAARRDRPRVRARQPVAPPGARRSRAGCAAELDEVPSLALDLDTPDDLAALRAVLGRRPGSAPTTAAALAELLSVPIEVTTGRRDRAEVARGRRTSAR